MVIIEHLIRAARRGVKVDVLVRPPHTLKREKLAEGVGGLRIMDDVGIKIHVDRLRKVAKHDWEHSHALDLSDEGLLADLDGVDGSGQLLALEDKDDYAGS